MKLILPITLVLIMSLAEIRCEKLKDAKKKNLQIGILKKVTSFYLNNIILKRYIEYLISR